MLIATWNVNSIRTRLTQVEEFLDEVQPDVICLQETKVEDKLFPKTSLEKRGYHVTFYGQKAYNGVAIISKIPFEDVRRGMKGELPKKDEAVYFDEQKRIISALIDGVRIVNLYVPNGATNPSNTGIKILANIGNSIYWKNGQPLLSTVSSTMR